MLQDVIHPPEQLPIVDESLSSPISSAQILDFCDNVFFPESLRSSEVSSCSGGAGGCCYDDNSYTTDLSFSSFPPDVANFNDNTISILLDSPLDAEPEIPTTLNFPSPFSIPPVITSNQHEQFDISSLQSEIPLTDVSNVNGFSPYSPDSVPALPPPQLLPSVFEEDCLCPVQSYGCLDPTSPSSPPFLDNTSGMGAFFGGNLNLGIAMAAVEASGMFSGSLQCQELEFQGENGGVYSSESVYSSGELQVLNENQQQLVVSGSCSSTAPFSTEMSAFEDSTFKVGRLSVEERKEKIHRYLKKRNERNFSKKIKYACRKTLADSRPRVRGRFAKNDEFGEAARPSCRHHEDDDEEEVRVKEEEMMDSSDIFAHISGVNSFKCNYPIQSWM